MSIRKCVVTGFDHLSVSKAYISKLRETLSRQFLNKTTVASWRPTLKIEIIVFERRGQGNRQNCLGIDVPRRRSFSS